MRSRNPFAPKFTIVVTHLWRGHTSRIYFNHYKLLETMDDSFHKKNVSKNCSHGSGKTQGPLHNSQTIAELEGSELKNQRKWSIDDRTTMQQPVRTAVVFFPWISYLFTLVWVDVDQFPVDSLYWLLWCALSLGNLEFCWSFGYLLCWKVPIFFRQFGSFPSTWNLITFNEFWNIKQTDFGNKNPSGKCMTSSQIQWLDTYVRFFSVWISWFRDRWRVSFIWVMQ